MRPPSLRRLVVDSGAVSFLVAMGVALLPTHGLAQQLERSWVTDQPVAQMLLSGTTLYVAGGFTQIGLSVGGGAPLDPILGAPLPQFPEVAGTVGAAVSDRNGGWVIGGAFTQVGGAPHSNLAHIGAGLTVDSWDPAPNGSVTAMLVTGDSLWVAGQFDSIGGEPRDAIALFDLTTLALTSWQCAAGAPLIKALAAGNGRLFTGGSFSSLGGKPRLNLGAIDIATGQVSDFVADCNDVVWTLALSGSMLYLGGDFSDVDDTLRVRLAAIDIGTGTLTPWNPSVGGWVRCLALHDGLVYVAGNFSGVDGLSRPSIAAIDGVTGVPTDWVAASDFFGTLAMTIQGDTLFVGGSLAMRPPDARHGLAAIDLATGALTAWDPRTIGDVLTLAPSGGSIYAGGTIKSLGAVERAGLAAIDVTTGAATSWNPSCDGTVRAMALAGPTVYVGGDFSQLGGMPRARIGAVDAETGAVSAWNPGANRPVRALATRGSTVYAGGDFTTIGGTARNRAAALDAAGNVLSWNPNVSGPVYALALKGDTLYAAGNFIVVSAQARYSIAAIDAETGALLPPDAGQINGYVNTILCRDSVLYIAGNFTRVHFTNRGGLAALTPDLQLTNWDPHPAQGSVFTTLVAHGDPIYVAGQFSNVGGADRNSAAALDPSSALATSWDPSLAFTSYPPTFACSAVDASRVYLGGSFTPALGTYVTGIAVVSHRDDARPTVHVVSPNGGEAFSLGEPVVFTWSAEDDSTVASIDLSLSRSGPNGPWEPIATGLPNSGSYAAVPGPPEAVGSVFVRAVASDEAGNPAEDRSDSAWTLVPDVAVPATQAIRAFELGPVSPSPARGTAHIAFAVPRRDRVTLSVLDVAGRRVASIANTEFAPGRYDLPWNVRSLRAGVYFLRLGASGVALSRRMLVLD